MNFVLAIFAGYLIGSTPVAVIITRHFGKINIFSEGSGNPGASNVYRTMGLRWAVIVLLLDVLKGYFPVHMMGQYYPVVQPTVSKPEAMIWVGLAAVIGHLWPVYTKFRGGKGVATMSGVLLAVAPIASMVTVLVWVCTIFWKRTFSVASITAALAFPIALYFCEGNRNIHFLGWGALVPLLILLTHHSNLRRILADSELPMNSDKED